MLKEQKLCIAATLALSALIGFYVGDSIPFSEQWKLYQLLLNVTFISFLVTSILWIIVYFDNRKNQSTNFDYLFAFIVNSVTTVAVIMFIAVLVPILKNIPALAAYKEYLRAMSFTLLLSLVFWKIRAIFSVQVPIYELKLKYELARARDRHINHLMGKR